MSYFLTEATHKAICFNQAMLERINEISRPLKDNFGIKLITYRRFFNNGDFIHLSSDCRWLEHSQQYHHWTSYSTLNRIVETPIGEQKFFIWEEKPNPNDSVYGALFEFDLWNGATVYEKNKNSTEVWAFSGDKSNPFIQDIYLNKNYILKRFILYFCDKAKDILDIRDRSKIIPGVPGKISLNQSVQDKKISQFIEQTEITRYFLKTDNVDVGLSLREAQCLFFLCQGKTTKEIGNKISLSSRTVEHYINNIKYKTSINSKSALINKHLNTIKRWNF